MRRFSFLVPALLCACASSPPQRDIVHSIRDPSELIRFLESHTDSLQDIRARARVSIEIEGVRQKASSVVFFRQPDDLRLEISGTLGISIMSAKFWGDSLRVYLPSEKGYLEGPSAAILYQVTGVDLSYYDVQRVILGLPTPTASDREHITGFTTGPRDYIIDIQHDRWSRRVWVDRVTLTLSREDIIDTQGNRRSQLLLQDYHNASGSRLPRRIVISQGANQIAFKVETHRVNTGLSDELFVQNIPAGVRPLDTEQ